jgi:hypothetical protein
MAMAMAMPMAMAMAIASARHGVVVAPSRTLGGQPHGSDADGCVSWGVGTCHR